MRKLLYILCFILIGCGNSTPANDSDKNTSISEISRENGIIKFRSKSLNPEELSSDLEIVLDRIGSKEIILSDEILFYIDGTNGYIFISGFDSGSGDVYNETGVLVELPSLWENDNSIMFDQYVTDAIVHSFKSQVGSQIKSHSDVYFQTELDGPIKINNDISDICDCIDRVNYDQRSRLIGEEILTCFRNSWISNEKDYESALIEVNQKCPDYIQKLNHQTLLEFGLESIDFQPIEGANFDDLLTGAWSSVQATENDYTVYSNDSVYMFTNNELVSVWKEISGHNYAKTYLTIDKNSNDIAPPYKGDTIKIEVISRSGDTLLMDVQMGNLYFQDIIIKKDNTEYSFNNGK